MSLEDFDLTDFWQQSAYATAEYVEAPITPSMIEQVEGGLGCKLPAAYVELAGHQNGGMPTRGFHPTAEPTSWSKTGVAIHGIFGIGATKPSSLLGVVAPDFESFIRGLVRD